MGRGTQWGGYCMHQGEVRKMITPAVHIENCIAWLHTASGGGPDVAGTACNFIEEAVRIEKLRRRKRPVCFQLCAKQMDKWIPILVHTSIRV